MKMQHHARAWSQSINRSIHGKTDRIPPARKAFGESQSEKVILYNMAFCVAPSRTGLRSLSLEFLLFRVVCVCEDYVLKSVAPCLFFFIRVWSGEKNRRMMNSDGVVQKCEYIDSFESVFVGAVESRFDMFSMNDLYPIFFYVVPK